MTVTCTHSVGLLVVGAVGWHCDMLEHHLVNDSVLHWQPVQATKQQLVLNYLGK